MKTLRVSFLGEKTRYLAPHYLEPHHLYRFTFWSFQYSFDCVPILAHFPSIFLFISCSLSLSHSCLMRRSRTAKRMNHAEWVPAVLLCPRVSALWSAVLAVIRADANSRGSRPTRSAGERKIIAVSVVQMFDIWLSLVKFYGLSYF